MAERTDYSDGEPCWADVTTPDLDAGTAFYGALFGWDFFDTGPDFGNYTMALKNGKPVAALTPPMQGSGGAPPAWSLYLASSDVAALAAKVEQGGGKILVAPMEIPGSGHMLYAFDPTGAAFGAWQPGEHRGSGYWAEPGALTWTELNTNDGVAADAFYRGLFGYRQQQVGDGVGFDYTIWNLDERTVCGRQQMTGEWAGIPPHWMVYFGVDDADAAAQRVTDGGGQVRNGPFDSPFGRIVVFTDPAGATASLIDESRRAQPQG
jgi:uncharacterized protein